MLSINKYNNFKIFNKHAHYFLLEVALLVEVAGEIPVTAFRRSCGSNTNLLPDRRAAYGKESFHPI